MLANAELSNHLTMEYVLKADSMDQFGERTGGFGVVHTVISEHAKLMLKLTPNLWL